MVGKFELKKGKSGQFMFNLKASNGQVILTSEQYKAKTGAMNGIESVRKNAGKDANFEHRTSKKNEPYFVLKAANKEIIGMSEMYASNTGRKKGIASVKKNARSAKIDDLT
jgi:uncharacterized protein YegP (UPF0339 family)